MQLNYYIFIKFYSEINHIYAFFHDTEVQMVSFITAVEINVHNFHLNAQTNEQNNTTHKPTNK